MRPVALGLALALTVILTAPALAAGAKPTPPCTPKLRAAGTPCVPFFGGALNIGDPPVTDTLLGQPSGAVTNYSLTGDGTVWNVNFSYTPGDPITDKAVGFLIYDDSWNVVTLQPATSNPPHSVSWPLQTTNGTVYQVQAFDYRSGKIQYTLGVTQGS